MRGTPSITTTGRIAIAGLLLLLFVGFAGAVPWAQAQLISPGKLSQGHQDLEGIRNCTSCHTLGSRGVDTARCLNCHEPLKARVDAERGFHATTADQDCAECHKEHFGVAFALVRFDTTRFDHADAGYRLTGAHQQASCQGCHRPALIVAGDVRAFKGRHGALDRTFLGLDTQCLSCHEEADPHGDQFADDDCAACHATDQWEEASRFDHDQARFKLTGRHRQVDCQTCHPQASEPGSEPFTRYEGIAFTNCSTCHVDAHAGAFGADCQTCHNDDGWHQIRNFAENRFDHNATGYALVGEHARLSCASCHTRPSRGRASIQLTFVRGTERHTYPRIQVSDCQSCHVDYHESDFADAPGGSVCENCHAQEAWVPVSYGLDRHNRETGFVLTGAHLATPCTACHRDTETDAPTFHFAGLECQSCHEPDDPHGAQFADAAGNTTCARCHNTEAWVLDDTFDHDQTGFLLTGQHVATDCASCHTPQRAEGGALIPQYRGLATDCLSCHSPDDPHQGQFEDRTCDACHDTAAFTLADFDHSQSRFPLDGAHREAMCGQCHQQETASGGDFFARYRPLSIACKDCHSDG